MSASLLLQAFVAAQITPIMPTSKLPESELRLLNFRYGKCVVYRAERRAEQALLSNADDATLLKRFNELFVPSCWPVQKGSAMYVQLHADRVRYALADSLFSMQLADKPPPNLASTPLLSHWDPGSEPRPPVAASGPGKNRKFEEQLRAYRERAGFSEISRFGECVVRTDPAAAKALLLTAPGTDEEATAMGGIRAALANCLPEGQSVKLTKFPIRGMIAVNYYRLAKASLDAGAPQ